MPFYTFDEAARIMATARNPEKGKPLQNNTRMYKREFGETVEYAIRLHSTDIVTILRPRNGMGTLYELSANGWETVTTRDRMTTYAPVWRTLSSKDGCWRLKLRPDPKDPEPEYPHRSIPKPFRASDPGPEPVKSPDGCIAGTHDTFEASEDHWCIMEYDVAKPWEFAFTRPGYRENEVKRYVRRASNAGIFYGERSQSHNDELWNAACERDTWYSTVIIDGYETTYKQCAHCKAFDTVHRAWNARYNGEYRYRRGYGGGYREMCEMLERFGSHEAWQEAYIEEYREVRQARKEWREWDERNHVGFFDGVIVDGNGYPLKRQINARLKAERQDERSRKRYAREMVRRTREAERLERFKDRARRATADRYVLAANNVIESLRQIGVAPDGSSENDDG